MLIVTGAPYSGKTTLCQSITAVELPVPEAIQKARELEAEGLKCKVIFLICHKDILIHRVILENKPHVFQALAEISQYREPCIRQIRAWFKDFMVLHTDGGIDLSAIGAFNAIPERRVEVSASDPKTPRILQGIS